MDIAYDRVQEEALSPSEQSPSTTGTAAAGGNINTELAQAFKAVSDSPWGSKLGGWFSQARKQGESFYNDLQKEATEAQEQATRGFSSLREQVAQRTRGMSLNAAPGPEGVVPGEEGVPRPANNKEEAADTAADTKTLPSVVERPESLPADIIKEAGSLVNSFRTTAAARLKGLQAAEDAADEALLKFGSNVRDFLRNAVTITAPTDAQAHPESELLFETSEPGTGKKIFHTTRLDAQLHAIHNATGSFTSNPEGEQWKVWQDQFDVEKETDAIASDLNKYPELRRAMEKLVPESVEYKLFWTRYYFLRKAIEEEEKRRKEVLRGAVTGPEEEVGWDDDEDDENDKAATPKTERSGTITAKTPVPSSTAPAPAADHLKPSRGSHEEESKSVADSDASYDIVSGSNTRTTSSPKEAKKDVESDDDWE